MNFLQAKDHTTMITWLASYPRSGNTFFRIIMRHRYGMETYSVYNDPRFEIDGTSDLVGHVPLPAEPQQMQRDATMYMVKTHDMPDAYAGPAIYLVRDARDAMVSWARYNESFAPVQSRWRQWWLNLRGGQFAVELAKLVHGRSAYGSWHEHVQRWTQRSDPTVVVRYEDLLADPLGTVDRALQAVGVMLEPVTDEPLPSFDQMHRRSPGFFRKGRSGSWREEMPPRLQRLFWMQHARAMYDMGYVNGPHCDTDALQANTDDDHTRRRAA